MAGLGRRVSVDRAEPREHLMLVLVKAWMRSRWNCAVFILMKNVSAEFGVGLDTRMEQ
jgi:hypothetical protein